MIWVMRAGTPGPSGCQDTSRGRNRISAGPSATAGASKTSPATSALPAVWSDQAGFKAAAEKAEGLAEKLAAAAKSGDPQATLAAFAALGKEGCGGCHQTFRKKES